MRAVGVLLRVTRKKKFATVDGGRRVLAAPKGPSTPPPKVAERCNVQRRTVDGFDVYAVRPREAEGRRNGAVIYLHGGAYAAEIAVQHWALIADIADRVRCTVHVPIYGLAPHHNAVEAIDFVTSVIRDLDSAEPVHLVGDSSGGGLALAIAQSHPREHASPMVGLTLIAPWLDVQLGNPAINQVEPHDPWLSRPGLRVIGQSWADELRPDDPRVSPINGPLEHLPPTMILVGTRDITMPDCRLLRDRLPAETLAYREVPGGLHVFPLLPVPEARSGKDAIVAHIRRTLQSSR